MSKQYLVGNKIKLVKFSPRYITPEYNLWLNDSDVNRYLYTGRVPVSYDELTIPTPSDNSVIKFAILSNVGVDSGDKLWQDTLFNYYIGTATIHHIDWISRRAEIGYMIGNKLYWGSGLATEVVQLMVDYSFNRLNLNKLVAGVIAGNKSSMMVLKKNGFKEYAIEKQEFYLENKYLDSHRFHIFK